MASYLDYIEDHLPDICTGKDLVAVGLFDSMAELTKCRLADSCPIYEFNGNHRVTYKKQDVLTWASKIYGV